jgi:hypothetical protein
MHLLVVALALTAVPLVHGHPGMAGLRRGPELFYANPALGIQTVRGQPHSAPKRLLPLGWAALITLPDRSPLYILAEQTDRLDLGRTIAQLQFPSALLVRLPDSPETIRLSVSSTQISLTDETGDSLLPENPRETHRPRTSLDFSHELPIIRRAWPWLVADLSLAAIADPARIILNPQLISLLSGSAISSQTEYGASLVSRADLAIVPSFTAYTVFRGADYRITLASRLAFPITLVHEDAWAQASVTTNDQSLPGATTAS